MLAKVALVKPIPDDILGCACDVPAHIYTYSFEPNTEWSSYYAGSSEIHDYFIRFARKYDLEKYVQLRTRVLGAVWDADKGKCKTQIGYICI